MKPRSMKSLTCTALVLLPAPAWAFDINRLQNVAQGDFRLLSEDVGAALSYHPERRTEPLGVTGFDVGLALTMSKVANKDALSRAVSGSVPSYIPVPTLRANKGLPLGFDVGLMYSKIPGSNIALWGGEARWAFLKGAIAEPAVGVRATYTTLTAAPHLPITTNALHPPAPKAFPLPPPPLAL